MPANHEEIEETSGEQTLVTPFASLEETKEKHAYIIFLSGPLMGKLHLLEKKTICLGRSADVDIPINDVGISRHHVEIECKPGKVVLKDLGSTNGTYLNGQRVGDPVELRDGDRIQISSATILKYAYQDQIENIFHEELYRMGTIDALTGAYNKRYFEGRIKEEFSYCFRNKVPLSLITFDIDHFKEINDTYGHPAGDYVLSGITALAKTMIRNEDILARTGGEEFVIMLKATKAGGALILAERLRKLIDLNDFEFEGHQIHATVSLGVATLSGRNFSDWQAMFQLTDRLLYQSKNAGRNRVSA